MRESGGLRARQAGRRGGCPCPRRSGEEGEGGGGGEWRGQKIFFVQSARKAVFDAHHAMNTMESDLRRKASNQICETEKCK